jgi:hypothetical protein
MAKRALKEQISTAVRDVDFLLSGEVEVIITWFLPVQERYERSTSPDVDNIVKPLLDAISGPSGLLVNDVQVQSLQCRWIDWEKSNQQLEFEIRFEPDGWLEKKNLFWVEVSHCLCMPLHTHWPLAAQKLMLNQWRQMFTMQKELLTLGGSYSASLRVMPIQQPFHRAKLAGFTVLDINDVERQIDAAQQSVQADGPASGGTAA